MENRCQFEQLSLLPSTVCVSMHEEEDFGLVLSGRGSRAVPATPLGRLYTGPFPLCWKQSGLLASTEHTQRLQSSRPTPTGGPSQALVCVCCTNLQLVRRLMMCSPTSTAVYGATKRGINFHFIGLSNLSQKPGLY